MTETIFTTRENLADTVRAQFIVDGMSEVDADMINDAIAFLESEARENGAEGAEIRSDYLDVRVIITAYADLAREAVKVGAAFLDSIRGDDWRALINRNRLDVSDVDRCPLGQLYGSYNAGLIALFDATEESEEGPKWGNAFMGCNQGDPITCCGAHTPPMSILTLAWLELLGEATPVSDPLLDLLNA